MAQTLVVTAASLLLSNAAPAAGFTCCTPRTIQHYPSSRNDVCCYVSPDISSQTSSNELHLLTFDLDDTIFPIDPVIRDANDAMIQTLHSLGFDGACNDEIIAASKRIRHELRMHGEAITYTDLRKRSIQSEMERLVNATDDLKAAEAMDADSINKVFDSWLNERHSSADRNLFPHASSSLREIRNQYPSVMIGAITNGRGNPFHMPSIAQYFDFCISGEDLDVFPLRKPDRGIYDAALRKAMEIDSRAIDPKEWNWIHVGDDLANDVGASAQIGAKTIWFTSNVDEKGEKGIGFWSTATPEEMKKREEMDALAMQFVDEEIYGLDQLVVAIGRILNA
jgi:FMN phosphatase YigB (HAD superfamily)